MSELNQFDISNFFDELQEPLFLIDYDDIIFFNTYFLENFKKESDSWRDFFSNEKVIECLDNFFENGERPKIQFIKSIKDNLGENHQYEWCFVNLPSSYNQRFLIVKGRKIKFFTESSEPDFLIDVEVNLGDELKYMQSILNNSHDLIAILDEGGYYKFISPSVADKLGFQVELIVGKNYKDFIDSGVIQLVKGDFKNLFESNNEVNIDFWINKPDGTRIYLESFGKNLLNHPQIQGIIFSARDITEYVQTDLSLQRRFEIENLINQISGLLINAPILNIEIIFKQLLERLGAFLNAFKSQIYLFNKDTKNYDLLSNWTSKDSEASMDIDFQILGKAKEFVKELANGKVKLLIEEERSFIFIPMISGSKLLGIIALQTGSQQFKEKELQIFRQLGDILGGAYRGSQLSKKIERNEHLLASTEILAKSGSWRYSTTKKMFFISGGLSNLFGLGDLPAVEEYTVLIKKIERETRNIFVQNLKKAIEAQSNSSGELIILNQEQHPTYVSYEIEARKDFLTQGLEVFGFCTDITHKRAADDYLKLQSQILAQVTDPILVTDNELMVIYLNEAAIQLCCPETAADFKGPFENLINVKFQNGENLKLITQSIAVGQSVKKEVTIKTKHTASSPFEISFQPLTSGTGYRIGYSFILRDLTEKHESQKLAKRIKLIVENSPAVLFRINPSQNYRINYISDNISQFGFSANELVRDKVSFFELLHPEDGERIKNAPDVFRDSQGIYSFSGEYRVKKKDGSYAWVEDKTRDVLDASGKIIFHEGLFQDITDRKNLEIFNQERDKQYRVLASNIPGTNIFLLDKSRRYILAEGTNFEKWGLSRESFEGKLINEITITDLSELNLLLDRVFQNREIVDTEFFYLGRYYQRTIRPIIENDVVEFVLSIIRDVHEEHEAKSDLLQSEDKYRTLVEESTEIIFSLTESFDFHYISPNVSQFLGYKLEEVLGHSIFEFLNTEDFDVFQTMLSSNLDFLAENQFLEFRIRHKNGDYKVFNSNGRMVERKHDSKRYYTGIARDISRLKEAQLELLMAKERAEQASVAKSQFLSVMSHEIRTPMNAVIGLSHFLLEENPRPDQLENLRTLQFSAENLMGLINDILDYNKIDSGKLELESVPFDLRNLINRIVHSHSFQANEKALKISAEIDGGIPNQLIGDSVRIGQIVNNLVSNAIKFTERGFVRISLQLENTEGSFCFIRFAFEDSGIGIPEQKLETIFEAFTQASSATTRKYGGTGLGLAIVKRLVEIHGGEIIVHSIPNEGSTLEFIIKFEFVKEGQNSYAGELSNLPKSLEKASILVAEDNAINQILIKKFLTKWNVGKLTIASDGQEALDEFEKENYSLVLLDLQMPVLDGFSVARSIRKNPDLTKRNTPILVLTASSLQEIKGEMEEIGINDFVPKPFTPEGLYEKLTQYLQTKSS
jgi:PAS domain S-box-containing protein